MNSIKFNKTLFFEFSMIFVCSSISFIYFYLRIINKQNVVSVTPENIHLQYNVFLYCFSISCLMIGLLLLGLILNVNENVNVYNIFYKCYVTLFRYLSPKYTQYLVTYANKIISYGEHKNVIIIFCAVVLPKMLLIFIFFLELYMKTLHYYFFSLFLLLIPLIFRFLLFIYSDIHEQVLPELNKIVERVPNTGTVTIETPEGVKTFGTIAYRFKPEFEYSEEGKLQDIDHFMFNYYNPMLFIIGHMAVYVLPLYYKINNITMYTYVFLHFIGWGYLLFNFN